MTEHKEICLKINGNQIVKLKSGSIKFKSYFKQLVVPFKIYTDFEYNLKNIHTNKNGNDTLNTETYSLQFCL